MVLFSPAGFLFCFGGKSSQRGEEGTLIGAMSGGQGRPLNFRIVHCSSEDETHPVTELSVRSNKTKGWQSEKLEAVSLSSLCVRRLSLSLSLSLSLCVYVSCF